MSFFTMTARALEKGAHTQDQTYRIERDEKHVKVEEVGTFVGKPDVSAKCVFTATPKGYPYICIEFQNEAFASKIEIGVSDDGNITLVHNGSVKEELPHSGEMLFFEGPNPMFDFINATLLLALQDGESKAVKVYGIDWSEGKLEPAQYTYARIGTLITVDKGTPDENSAITLSPETFAIMAYKSGASEYAFSM